MINIIIKEKQVPHDEINDVIACFKNEDDAIKYINEDYNKELKEPYLQDKCFNNKLFSDCIKYILSEDGYYVCWKIKKFNLK